jgi:hypothetical protein
MAWCWRARPATRVKARGLKTHGAMQRPILAQSESGGEWERFLGDLFRRGLDSHEIEIICVDGGWGLLAALLGTQDPTVLGKVQVVDQPRSRPIFKLSSTPTPWASSQTEPQWIASCPPSSITKTKSQGVGTPLLLAHTF